MSKVNKSDREYIYSRDGNKCLQCGSSDNLTIDHIVPIALGGKNHINNYQTLCQPCNLAKGKKIRDLRGLKVVGKIALPKHKRKKVIPILYSTSLPDKQKEKIKKINEERTKSTINSVNQFKNNLSKKYPHAYSLIEPYMWTWIYDNLIKKIEL